MTREGTRKSEKSNDNQQCKDCKDCNIYNICAFRHIIPLEQESMSDNLNYNNNSNEIKRK